MESTMQAFITKGDAILLSALLQRAETAAPRRNHAIETLLEVLSVAHIVDDLPGPLVRIGCRVRYKECVSDQVREVTLVLPHEVAPTQGLISVLSPLGGALFARAPGERVSVRLPNGRMEEHLIVEVLPAVGDENRVEEGI